MHNPELDKKADSANKAYNRFKAAARRKGISEKMMQESNYDFSKWPGVQALYDKWREEEKSLDLEAEHPSQPQLSMEEGGGKEPATGGRRSRTEGEE